MNHGMASVLCCAVEEAGDLLEFGLEASMEEILDEGLQRLQGKETWKLWQWPDDGAEFFDADSFRQHMHDKHIKEELLRLLPRDDPKSPEKPAEAALRQRMTDLLQRIQQSNRQLQEEGSCGRQARGGRTHRATQEQLNNAVRDSNIEMISTMLEVLEQEHDHLYMSLLKPITSFICELLPEEMRETNSQELYFEDLEKVPGEEVARICEWLTEKVDALSTKLKAEPKDEEVRGPRVWQ